MIPQEFEQRIIDWARRQPDIVALVQIGSRVQAGGQVDAWSDWDYHLISTRPERYNHPDWVAEIAPPWCAHAEQSRRGVVKVTAIFAGGPEADFVLLKAWQMKLLYWGMRHPEWSRWMPARLVRGILEMRVILLGSGHRVLIGGPTWEQRLQALAVAWAPRRMIAEEFDWHVSAFWQKSVWVELLADQAALVRCQVALDLMHYKLANSEQRIHRQIQSVKGAVCGQFGSDSNEYAALGMKKKSERRRGGGKARPATRE